MKVAIIGSGFCGMSAAYETAKAGYETTIFERDSIPGGLAATFHVGGQELEKFYHHWLGTDEDIFNFARELGYGSKLQFKTSKVGIYYANENYRFSSPLDLLRFKPLPFLSRIRFGLSILYSWTIRNTSLLEQETAVTWLRKVSGKNAYETIWKPLLIGKFGEEYYQDVAAIWIWNKLIQRGKSRDSKAKEFLGYYDGGFSAFIRDVLDKIEELGGKIKYNSEVKKIRSRDSKKVDLKINGKWESFDRVIYTGHTPELADLYRASGFEIQAKKLDKIQYLANVCLILETNKSLSDTYWLNVNDVTFPFVGIIEHTNFETIDSYDGKHLIYLSKYIPRSHAMYAMSNDEMLEFAIPHLKRLFPDFNEASITRSFLWKANFAQPLICKDFSQIIPPIRSEIENFYISTMAQVYPEDRGTNYAVKHGRSVGRLVAETKYDKGEKDA